MNCIHCLAAMLALCLSTVRAEPPRRYDFDSPDWDRKVLQDPQAVSGLLKQAAKAGKIRNFYLSVENGPPSGWTRPCHGPGTAPS